MPALCGHIHESTLHANMPKSVAWHVSSSTCVVLSHSYMCYLLKLVITCQRALCDNCCVHVSMCVTFLHLSECDLCKCLSMTGMLTDVMTSQHKKRHVWRHLSRVTPRVTCQFLLLTHQSTYLLLTIADAGQQMLYLCMLKHVFVKTCHVSMCVICQVVPIHLKALHADLSHSTLHINTRSCVASINPCLNCQLFPFITNHSLIQLPLNLVTCMHRSYNCCYYPKLVSWLSNCGAIFPSLLHAANSSCW